MDETRSAFGCRIELSEGDRIIFGLSYGQLVWSSQCNQNIMFDLYNFRNVQSLNVLNIGVSCAFMLVLFLCNKGTWQN